MEQKGANMIELKRCPFCGGDNVSLWYNRSISPRIPTTCEVHCYDCHFGLQPSKTKEDAIKAWNTRKPVENVLERLEEAETAVNGHKCEKDDCADCAGCADCKIENAYAEAIKIIKEEVG